MTRTNDIIGICTWTLGIADLDALMAKIAAMGLNGVQYCESLDAHSAADVKAAAARHGLTIIVNDPFDCRPGERHGAATLASAIAFYRRAIDFAAELGCGQTLQGLGAWTVACDGPEAVQAFMIAALQDLSTYASSRGVPLAYEPCNLYEVPVVHTATEFQALMDASGCDDIQILLDSFHMNIGETDPLGVLRQYANRNAVFHISDSNRGGIGHGHIDFEAHHKALVEGGFNGPCAIELVLSGNPVNTPPRDANEMAALTAQIEQSIAQWRRFSHHS